MNPLNWGLQQRQHNLLKSSIPLAVTFLNFQAERCGRKFSQPLAHMGLRPPCLLLPYLSLCVPMQLHCSMVFHHPFVRQRLFRILLFQHSARPLHHRGILCQPYHIQGQQSLQQVQTQCRFQPLHPLSLQADLQVFAGSHQNFDILL